MIAIAAVLALVLNLVDAIATMVSVQRGIAIEANPIMAAALDMGAWHFFFLKLALTTAGVVILWRLRDYGIAQAGLYALAVLYAGVCAYHVYGLGGF